MLGVGPDMTGAEVARGQQRRGPAVPASLQGNRGLQTHLPCRHGQDRPDTPSLGLTRGNCKDEILALSVLDYSLGPQPDLNRSGEVWVFGKSISGLEIYIKLKIVETPSSEAAVCLSFHIAERPMAYPLKP